MNSAKNDEIVEWYDHYEPIQNKIDIVCSSIRSYQSWLNASKDNEPNLAAEIRKKLMKEEENLTELKIQYPEYFI